MPSKRRGSLRVRAPARSAFATPSRRRAPELAVRAASLAQPDEQRGGLGVDPPGARWSRSAVFRSWRTSAGCKAGACPAGPRRRNPAPRRSGGRRHGCRPWEGPSPARSRARRPAAWVLPAWPGARPRPGPYPALPPARGSPGRRREERIMIRRIATKAAPLLLLALWATPSAGIDRPFGTSGVHVRPQTTIRPELDASAGSGNTGGQFSKVQIERFRCTSSGDPAAAVDMSCNTTELGQDFSPGQRDRGGGGSAGPGPRRGRIQRLLLPVQQLHRRPPGDRAHRVLHQLRRRRDLDRRADPDALRQRRRRSVRRVRPEARRDRRPGTPWC